MKRYSNRSNFSTLSEINVTPLLDLAFVLLIIFMITTPLLENSMNLVIPSSSAANAPISKAQVQTISIDRNRLDLRLANGRVSRAARRNHQIHAIFEQRRSDHKNNQQHKSEIEQRGDVDFA